MQLKKKAPCEQDQDRFFHAEAVLKRFQEIIVRDTHAKIGKFFEELKKVISPFDPVPDNR